MSWRISPYIMGSGTSVSNVKAKVIRYGLMVVSMKAVGSKTKLMVLVDISIPMVITLLVSGQIIAQKAKDFISM